MTELDDGNLIHSSYFSPLALGVVSQAAVNASNVNRAETEGSLVNLYVGESFIFRKLSTQKANTKYPTASYCLCLYLLTTNNSIVKENTGVVVLLFLN